MKRCLSLLVCLIFGAIVLAGCAAQGMQNPSSAPQAASGAGEPQPAAASNEDGAEEPFVVKTQYGEVRGAAQDGVLAYKGIPFAAPPLEELRFAPPQPPQPWEGV